MISQLVLYNFQPRKYVIIQLRLEIHHKVKVKELIRHYMKIKQDFQSHSKPLLLFDHDGQLKYFRH